MVPAAGDRSYNSRSIQGSSSRRQKLQQQKHLGFQQQETEATTAGAFRVPAAGTEATIAGAIRVPAAGNRSYNSRSI
jgi:hypothetical protein